MNFEITAWRTSFKILISASGKLKEDVVCSKMEHTTSDGKNYKLVGLTFYYCRAEIQREFTLEFDKYI